MKKHHSNWRICFTGIGVLCVAAQLCAQPAPPGFGGGGGSSSSSSRSRTSSSSSRQYPNRGAVGDAVISMDAETRSLIFIADDETSQYISQVVSNLDRPSPQVLIKVVFLEVTHNNSSDIGVEGGWGKSIGNSATGALANAFGMSALNSASGTNSSLANVFGQPVSAFGATPPGAGLYQIFAQDYQVTLRAIAQAGKVKVLSRPSVIARNNQPATITVGQSVPLVTSVRYDTYGNAINSISYTSIGIILRVTPYITPNGMVEMILSPETSELVADRSQWVPISGSVSAPLINSRSADTVVVTPDGQTVIIGGLMQDSKAESESKIPVLGDLPLLGKLFKRTAKSDARSELLIFLTPHIVQAPSELATLTASEREKSETSKAFTDRELNQFLDTVPAVEPDPATAKTPGSRKSGSPAGSW